MPLWRISLSLEIVNLNFVKNKEKWTKEDEMIFDDIHTNKWDINICDINGAKSLYYYTL